MNVLFVVPYVPNLIRVRPFNLIRSLSLAGHKVTVATLWSSAQDRQDINKLKGHCHEVIAVQQPKWQSMLNCVRALPTSAPLQSVYSWSPALGSELQRLLRKPEQRTYHAVHVEHLRGARYAVAAQAAIHAAAGQGENLPTVVWDSVDCISYLFRQASQRSTSASSRLVTRFELGRTERFERYLVGQFDDILVTSKKDREALRELSAQKSASTPIHVLTNGVDLDYFTPGNPSVTVPDSLILSGKMSYHANVSMAIFLVKEIMPLVWANRPATRVFIVGKDPAPEVSRLAANPLVHVTGTVQDIREYLRQATVSVSPITYGAGIQNKILEAMACGAPVVTSGQGASPLNIQSGEELMIADTPQEFAKAIQFLLENPEARRAMAARGRQYVNTNHHWDHIAGELAGIYQSAYVRKNHTLALSGKSGSSKSTVRV